MSHNKLEILFHSRHQMAEWQLVRCSTLSRHCELNVLVTREDYEGGGVGLGADPINEKAEHVTQQTRDSLPFKTSDG